MGKEKKNFLLKNKKEEKAKKHAELIDKQNKNKKED